MSKAKDFIQTINEMSFSRNSWIERVRDRFIGGALGEYAKLVIAREVGIPKSSYSYWEKEISRLLSNIDIYMDKRVALSSKFDRKKMLKEALKEAATFQDQITSAKNELVLKYVDKYDEIRRISIGSQELIVDMLKEFLPKYLVMFQTP
jgi:hypothetical protein